MLPVSISQTLRAWVAFLAALGVTGFQAQQAISGQGWNPVVVSIIALAVVKVAWVYFTENAPVNLGIDAHAKTVVAAVFAALITVLTVLQPILESNRFTASDMGTIVFTVLGALGVFSVNQTPIVAQGAGTVISPAVITTLPSDPTVVAGTPTADGVPQDDEPAIPAA